MHVSPKRDMYTVFHKGAIAKEYFTDILVDDKRIVEIVRQGV